MDFSLTTLFVLPQGNVPPSAGTTDELTGTTFGVYNNKYQAVTPGNIAGAPYIYLAQNRKVPIPGLGTKRSDKIYKSNVLAWYKVPSVPTVTHQITEVSGFYATCGQEVVLTLRLFSSYIELAYYNGLTRSYTVTTPCCDCGSDPCTETDPQALADQLVNQVNSDELVTRFLSAERTGEGADSKIVITGSVLDKYGNRCSPVAFTYEYDKLRFDVFATHAPLTTQDFEITDRCAPFATVTLVQPSSYPTGSGDEIYELEKWYFSYQSTHKSLFKNNEFDGAFERESDTALFYTTYYLKYRDNEDISWGISEKINEAVIIAVPAGEETYFEALMNMYLGAPSVYAAA